MINLIIVGVGGQGTLLSSKLLGRLAVDNGYDVKVSEVHGMAQRGGGVVTHVRMSDREPVYSPLVEPGCADTALAFEQLEALRAREYCKAGGRMIVNTQKILPMPVITGADTYPAEFESAFQGIDLIALDAFSIAKRCGNTRGVNVVLMGILAKTLPFSKEAWLSALERSVPAKTREVNTRAFLEGYAM